MQIIQLSKAALAAILSFYFISCTGSQQVKTVNPLYLGKVFKDKTLGVFLLDSLINATDKNTNEFLETNYGNFESLLNECLPKYLSEYSHAKDPCFINIEKKYFIDKLIFKNKKSWEYIVSPVKGTILKDQNNNVFDLVLILCRTTIRSFNGYVNSSVGSQGYLSQNSGHDGHITINGRMILWDNNKGDAVAYGVFNAIKFIPPLTELTKQDFENCMKLLVLDITSDSPLFDETRITGIKKLR